MPSYPLHKILHATNGQAVGLNENTAPGGISTDTRTLRPGDVFWALRGPRYDGHDFARTALESGAIAVVVEKNTLPQVPVGGSYIVVNNTTKALGDLAREHRNAWSGNLVAITGSVGKTTTRRMIHSVLSARLDGVQSPKNYNNHIGVPLTLLELGTQHQFAAVELAASAVGEIDRLTRMAQPTIAVITGIAAAHLERFGSLAAIATAKSEILNGLGNDGLAILPADAPQLRPQGRCRVQTIGEEISATVRLQQVRVMNEFVEFQIGTDRFRVPAVGRHHARAGAIAVAVARELDLTTLEIRRGFERFRSVQGRCHLLDSASYQIIDDTYNANPASALAACRTLRDWQTAGRKHLVFGDMLELGSESREYHRQLGQQASGCGIQSLSCLGKYAGDIVTGAVKEGFSSTNAAACSTLHEVQQHLTNHLSIGDTILVKGSRSLMMERVVEWLVAATETKSLKISSEVEFRRRAA